MKIEKRDDIVAFVMDGEVIEMAKASELLRVWQEHKREHGPRAGTLRIIAVVEEGEGEGQGQEQGGDEKA